MFSIRERLPLVTPTPLPLPPALRPPPRPRPRGVTPARDTYAPLATHRMALTQESHTKRQTVLTHPSKKLGTPRRKFSPWVLRVTAHPVRGSGRAAHMAPSTCPPSCRPCLRRLHTRELSLRKLIQPHHTIHRPPRHRHLTHLIRIRAFSQPFPFQLSIFKGYFKRVQGGNGLSRGRKGNGWKGPDCNPSTDISYTSHRRRSVRCRGYPSEPPSCPSWRTWPRWQGLADITRRVILHIDTLAS